SIVGDGRVPTTACSSKSVVPTVCGGVVADAVATASPIDTTLSTRYRDIPPQNRELILILPNQ
ncbi:unnamed protein product, partial [Macrosiphum euphorbiae]